MSSHSVRRSVELYQRAGEVIPGWTQLISRRASQYANGISPVYATSAKGSRFTDVDGNEYIDWVSALGAIVLGHADDVVDTAVKEQIDRGSLFSINHPLEIELAEALIETIPSAEMVRYAKGGGEACAIAVRIARGVKERDKVLFCGYHGWHDWYQAANYLCDPEDGEYPFAGIEPIGVPKVLAGTAIPFAYGDLEMLRALLEEHRGEVACVMMEPMRSTLPDEGYLEDVKALLREHDVILIFDEVSCGFRVSPGGVQEYLGVTPDMTVLAKALGNGYPMGAVVGSREVMEPASRMFISSSYWSDNVGLVAALTTIQELKNRNSAERFKEIGEKLREAIGDAIRSAGMNGEVRGFYTSLGLHLELPDESLRPKVNTLYIQEMARRGVHCLPGFKACLAHSDKDIKDTAEASEGAFGVIRKALETDSVDERLECNTRQDAFRRLVH